MMSDNNPKDGFDSGTLSSQIRMKDAEIKRLREALYEASESLRSISRLAGKEDLATILDIRGYANSRYMVARKALEQSD